MLHIVAADVEEPCNLVESCYQHSIRTGLAGLGHNLGNLAARTLAGIFFVVNKDFAVGQGRAVFPQAVDYVEISFKPYIVAE